MRENALELHGVCKKYGGFALRKWDLPCREAR